MLRLKITSAEKVNTKFTGYRVMSEPLVSKLTGLADQWEVEAELSRSPAPEEIDEISELDRLRWEEEYKWGIYYVEQLRAALEEINSDVEMGQGIPAQEDP